MEPRKVILICGLSLIGLGGVVLLQRYITSRAATQHPQENMEGQSPHQRNFHPAQPVQFQHPAFDRNTDCSLCHRQYTLKDTVKIK